MEYRDFCVRPETELDTQFIESEIKFLLDVSVKKQNEFKDKYEWADTVKQHYRLWLENYGRSKTSNSH